MNWSSSLNPRRSVRNIPSDEKNYLLLWAKSERLWLFWISKKSNSSSLWIGRNSKTKWKSVLKHFYYSLRRGELNVCEPRVAKDCWWCKCFWKEKKLTVERSETVYSSLNSIKSKVLRREKFIRLNFWRPATLSLSNAS